MTDSPDIARYDAALVKLAQITLERPEISPLFARFERQLAMIKDEQQSAVLARARALIAKQPELVGG